MTIDETRKAQLMLDPRRVPPATTDGLTQRARILKRLIDTRLANKPIIHIDGGPGNQVIRSGGYMPIHAFNDICSARQVRMWELKSKLDVPISDPPHVFDGAFYINSKGERVKYSTPQYRIELEPLEILALDWSRMWEKPMGIFVRVAMTIDGAAPRAAAADVPQFERGQSVTIKSPESDAYGSFGTVIYIRADKRPEVQMRGEKGSAPFDPSALVLTKNFKRVEL